MEVEEEVEVEASAARLPPPRSCQNAERIYCAQLLNLHSFIVPWVIVLRSYTLTFTYPVIPYFKFPHTSELPYFSFIVSIFTVPHTSEPQYSDLLGL